MAWLSLDEGDNDLSRLLRYLVAAIQQAIPGAAGTAAQIAHAPRLPTPADLADLLNHDLAAIDGGLVFVLDDYHVLEADAAHHFMRQLIDALPDHVHLVVTSRVDPPWPLGRMRVRQQLVEIRARHLQWNLEEVRALLERATGAPVDEALAAALHARTEGWVAGLRLAAISLHGGQDPVALTEALRESEHYMMEYLFEEVLAQQPAVARTFLLATALVDRFCASLADALLEGDAPPGGSTAVLADLERRGLFLTPLDPERHWYRYHQLFRDLLVHRLREEYGHARIDACYRRAAGWFAEQHLVEEAIQYALAAGDTVAAAGALEAHLHVAFDYGSEQATARVTIKRWLGMLPADLMEERPGLLVIRAYVCTFTFDIKLMPPLLDRAEALLDRDQAAGSAAQAALRGDIAGLRACVAFWSGDFEAVHRYAEQALALFPRHHYYVRGLTQGYDALAHTLQGRHERAVGMLREALVAESSPSGIYEGATLCALGSASLYAGDLAHLTYAAERMCQLTSRADLQQPWVAWGHYQLARCYYERGELAEAATHFAAIVGRQPYANSRCYHDSLLGLALASQACGEPARARDYAAQANAFALETGSPTIVEASYAFEARLALLQGNTAEALRRVSVIESSGPIATQYWLELVPLSRAQILIAEGTPSSLAVAVDLLEQLLRELESIHHPWQSVRLLSLYACALWAQGHTNAALRDFDRALELGQAIGCVRSFLDLGALGAELLAQMARQGALREYAVRILAVGDTQADPALKRTNRLATPSLLTEREVEVLRLLSKHLTNDEIAERLVIASNTVKKHISNIYGKLQATNRRTALAHARHLGILSALD